MSSRQMDHPLPVTSFSDLSRVMPYELTISSVAGGEDAHVGEDEVAGAEAVELRLGRGVG